MNLDILSIMVIVFDLGTMSFLTWRATAKKATLWGAARFIYLYVAATTLYHAVIYSITLFHSIANQNAILMTYLHPFVFMYVINTGLIAIIHWRGGHL